MNVATRLIMLGALALLIVSIMDPSNFYSWLIDTLFGIAMSAFFFAPLSKLVAGQKEYITAVMLVGIVIYILYTYIYLGGDWYASFLSLCKWLAVFALISVVANIILSEIKEELREIKLIKVN